jgi:hypothetical protein
MMKNKAKILGAGLLALLLTLAGCVNPLSEKPEAASSEAASGGTIVVRLSGLDARTLGPDVAEELAALQYRLVITGGSPAQFIEKDIEHNADPVAYSLESGSWTVGVAAFKDDAAVAWGDSGTTPFALRDGETKDVPITLKPWTKEDAAGKFDYAVVFPEPTEDLDYAATTLKLTPTTPNSSSPSPISINLRESGKDAAVLEFPAGKYILDIKLESKRQVYGASLQAIVKEVVYIYPALTTTAHYTFTEADFGALVYLKGTASVDNNTAALGEEGAPVHGYIPAEVQIKLFDSDPDEPDDDNIQTAPITLDEESGAYTWNLAVDSEKINGSGNVTTAELRFVVESGTYKLTGPWATWSISNKQGRSGIALTAAVYSIVKETGDDYFSGIEGVEGIAHNSDAIAETEVKLRVKPVANYGVRGDGGSTSYNYGGSTYYPTKEPDGAFSFTMPSSSVTVSADFFHLAGTVENYADASYTPKTIEAFGEIPDEENEGDYVWAPIGSAAAINAADNTWTIPFADGFVAFTNNIRFKVTLQAEGKTNQVWIGSSYTDYLTGTNTAALNIYSLFAVNNLRAQSSGTSVALSWDAAEWATEGYEIQRSVGGGEYTTIATPSKTAASYTDTGLTPESYTYRVWGKYKTTAEGPVQNGNSSYVTAVILSAPENVSAASAANEFYPFRVSLSWDSVPNVTRYDIYRSSGDGSGYEEIGISFSASYNDTSDKIPGTRYTYRIAAVNTSYDVTSGQSDQSSPVSFSATSLSLGDPEDGYISVPGEYDYYRFTVLSDGSYQVSYYSSDSLYGYVAVYVDGSLTGGTGGSTSFNYPTSLNSGDEIILVVKAVDFSSTGSYSITISQP